MTPPINPTEGEREKARAVLLEGVTKGNTEGRIAQALATHRAEVVERCAGIAENISVETSYPHYQYTADAVATAIRHQLKEKA